MKTTNFSGLWKAIVFLAAVLTVLFSCSSCEPEEPPVVYETSITLAVEGVTEQSANLVAEVMAGNQNLQVIFECFIDNAWKRFEGAAVSGIEKKTVKKELTNLNPELSYRVRSFLLDYGNKKIAASQEQEFVTTKTEASVSLSQLEVGRDKATFMATVKGRNNEQELSLWFEYLNQTSWEWERVFVKNISGAVTQEIEHQISDLTPGVKYKIRAYLLTPSELKLANSSELEFKTPKSALFSFISANVGITTIALNLELTPYYNTTVTIDYQSRGGALKTFTSEVYSGDKLIPLEFKLENLEKNMSYEVEISLDDLSIAPVKLSLETYAVSDYDGNLYHLVTIGNQTFLRENLKATHFLNGDPIPNVKDDQDWYNFNAPAYCYYNNDPALGEKYGALYNFYAASDPRGFIAGFHTPTIEEFEELIVYLGGEYAAGGKAKTTTSDWQSPNMGASNSSGFSALPAGTRSYSSGGNYEQPEFVGLGELAKFWTGEIEPALPQAAYSPYCRYTGPGFFYNSLHFHWAGFSVRLVKD